MDAAHRLLAEHQVTDPPKQDQDRTWQKRMEDSYRGKGRRAAFVIWKYILSSYINRYQASLNDKGWIGYCFHPHFIDSR
jgi:hypothetical protein